MAADFSAVFSALKPVLSKYATQLTVKADTPAEYTLHTKRPSPFPQHKGHALYFGSVRLDKAYVSVHLMPLYLCPPLITLIPPALKKRMHGKTCFNFNAIQGAQLIANLAGLTKCALDDWRERKWA
jgi:hypothetical protein